MRRGGIEYDRAGLCGAPTSVIGAEPCPRAKAHAGEHYWWIPWIDGRGDHRVIIYSGEPAERVRRARGVFRGPPEAADVYELLTVLSPLKKREVAARTPHSEPTGSSKAIPMPKGVMGPYLEPQPGGMVAIRG